MTTQLTITVRVVPGAGMSAQNTPLNSGSQPYSQSIKCQIPDILQLRDTYLESFVIAYLLISVLFPKSLDAKSILVVREGFQQGSC